MRPLPSNPSLLLEIGFVILSFSLVAGFAFATRSLKIASGGIIWLTFTGIVAKMGLLSDFSSVPPRVLLLFFPTFIATAALSFSSIGSRVAALPISLLVGYQGFRLIVELLIHRAVNEGVAPVQMTWSGLNLDIITGISALLLFPFASRLPRWSILAWNTMGMLLLIWVVGVAILSFPTPFQKLKPDNVWVAHFPFVWLPTIAVTAALFGHLVVYRKFCKTRKPNK